MVSVVPVITENTVKFCLRFTTFAINSVTLAARNTGVFRLNLNQNSAAGFKFVCKHVNDHCQEIH